MAPCADCARGLINSGITRVVYLDMFDEARKTRWAAKNQLALSMLEESGVETICLASFEDIS